MKRAESVAGRPGLFATLRQKKRAMNIQSRIFLYFLLFTALLLVLLWLFQIVFLEDFYRMEKTDMIKATSASIARNIDHEELETLIRVLAEENNLCALVTDEDMNILYSADAAFNSVLPRLNSRDLRRMAEQADNDKNNGFYIFPMMGFKNKSFDDKQFAGRVPPPERSDGKSLVSVQKVAAADGSVRYVLLNTFITPVTSTVQTIRKELFAITGILVLLSFILSSLLSRRISQPIVNTTKAARELSKGEYTPIDSKIYYKEIVELDAQLMQTAKDLRRVEEMQRELIANISHDLRTPLTLIEGYVEVMRDLPGENTPENLQVILDETKRLTTLVNAVLDYSKNKQGGTEMKPERFNLTAEIRDILTRYGKLTEQDGYQIVFQPERDVFVRADRVMIGQVIYNLTNNALTYTGDDKTVEIVQSAEDGQVKLEIKDSGEGIEPEELPFIWTRYYRGKKPHKRPTVGTGLGLNIVQGILEKHGLKYGVESQPEQGSDFWFVLPECLPEGE